MGIAQYPTKTQIIANNEDKQIDITSYIKEIVIKIHPDSVIVCDVDFIVIENDISEITDEIEIKGFFLIKDVPIIETVITKYGIRIVLDIDFNASLKDHFKH